MSVGIALTLLQGLLFGKAYGLALVDAKEYGEGLTILGGALDTNLTLILSLNPNGSVERALGFNVAGYAIGISGTGVANDGSVFVTGSYLEEYGGTYQAFLIKIGPDGSVEWANLYTHPSSHLHGKLVCPLPDGGAILICTYKMGFTGYMMLVARVNSDGSVFWAEEITSNDYNSLLPKSFAPGPNGEIFVVGRALSNATEGMIIVFDSAGGILWSKEFTNATSSTEELYGVAAAPDGSCVVAGICDGYGALAKISPDGTLEWAKGYRTYKSSKEGFISFNSVDRWEDGWLAIGTSNAFGVGLNDLLTLRLSSDGTMLWGRVYTKALHEKGEFAIVLPDESDAFLIGTRTNYDTGEPETIIIRVGGDGNYADCLLPASPNAFELTASLTDLGATASAITLTVDSLSCQIGEVAVEVSEICPTGCEESACLGARGLICASVRGGLLFNAFQETSIKVFRADGSLAFSGRLTPGKNLVKLPPGIYLWKTDGAKGKGIVLGR